MANTANSQLPQLAELLRQSRKMVVFSGTGMSMESGMPSQGTGGISTSLWVVAKV